MYPIILWKNFRKLNPRWLWWLLHALKGVLLFKQTERIAMLALKVNAKKRDETFENKILYKMAFDRNPMLTVYADKVKVREFVKDRIGTEFLTASFGVFESIRGLQRSLFPQNFVIKANHGSGAAVICWEGAPRGEKIPSDISGITWQKYLIHPDDLDWKRLIRLSDKWMTLNYCWDFGRYPEWSYKNIKPLILVEELLLDGKSLPFDYKFHMINGRCAFIQVDVARYGQHKRNLYSENWNLINAKTPFPRVTEVLPKPPLLAVMLKVAEAISRGIDFVRIDLYTVDGRVVFGEMTNYPNGGLAEIWPKGLSVELAKNWTQQ